MRATLAGVGARSALAGGGQGWVVASFRRACYLTIAGRQVVLVAPDVDPGPIHLVLDGAPPPTAPGAEVAITGNSIVIDGAVIDLGRVATWRGAMPEPAAIRRRAAAIAEVARSASPGSALEAEPFAAAAARARALLPLGRLQEAAGALAGLGPGLTPSGDDAIAGIAFALRAALGRGIEPTLLETAQALPPGSLGVTFVEFAARGQALAPVHDVVGRGAAGDLAGAEEAAAAVASVGESSGRDLLLGLSWGLAPEAIYGVAASEGLLVAGDPPARADRGSTSR